MKAIGGYPELELRKGEHYHKDAIRLNTARNCLEYILRARRYKKVYLPYYTCDAVLEPFNKMEDESPEIVFYHINKDLEPIILPTLREGEAFLYTNYFGLKQDAVERLASIYEISLIVDNSQAFYDMPLPGVDTFYSARKFFGVPDGAYLYTDSILVDYDYAEIETDKSFDRMGALLKRIDLGAEKGYIDFQKVEDSLCEQPIRKMSRLTETLLSSIDYEWVRTVRRNNYQTLGNFLSNGQGIRLKLTDNAVPLCYPFLAEATVIRKKLIDNRIFVATYWPNVFNCCEPDSTECWLAQNLLPLPIDQRYGEEDMKRIIEVITGN